MVARYYSNQPKGDEGIPKSVKTQSLYQKYYSRILWRTQTFTLIINNHPIEKLISEKHISEKFYLVAKFNKKLFYNLKRIGFSIHL